MQINTRLKASGVENDSLTDQNFYGASKGVKTRFYKNWYESNKKAFANYSKKFESVERKRDIQCQLERMKKYGPVIKVLAHTQVSLLTQRLGSRIRWLCLRM